MPLTDDNIVTVAQKLQEYPVTKEGCIITTFLNLAVNLLNFGLEWFSYPNIVEKK